MHRPIRTTEYPRLNLDAIRAAHPLPEVVGAVVKLHRAGNEWKACCPFHNERTPSFTVFDGGRRFQCFGCGASGDVLDFVQRLHGVGLVEAARLLGSMDLPAVALPPAPHVERQDRSGEARDIFARAVPAAGSLAEAYLRYRGVSPPFPPDIRFSYLPCGSLGMTPAMVCGVRDIAGEITGIQRVFLRADGQGKADIPKPKLSLGAVKGGAIRLGELDGSGMVTVCEGPEDGLSLMEMLGGSVWVAAGSTFLPHMRFPPEVRRVVIGADNDPTGRGAADKAAHAFTLRGLSVRIIKPLDGYKDFNEELKGSHP
jgi:DNA primase